MPIEIPKLLWKLLLSELRHRGQGERESGAFLLGADGSTQVSQFLCYDDLDGDALSTGIITFHARGFVRLWDICKTENLKVIADVHTHPSSWTGQSESDRTHPMVAQPGHVALILPNFAKRNLRALNGASIYEYLGDHQWRSRTARSGYVKISSI